MKRIAKHLLTALKTTGLQMKTVTELAQEIADQELEATLAEVSFLAYRALADRVRAARRPKPQMLTSIALQMLDTIERDARYLPEITDTIRRALEALPND